MSADAFYYHQLRTHPGREEGVAPIVAAAKEKLSLRHQRRRNALKKLSAVAVVVTHIKLKVAMPAQL